VVLTREQHLGKKSWLINRRLSSFEGGELHVKLAS